MFARYRLSMHRQVLSIIFMPCAEATNYNFKVPEIEHMTSQKLVKCATWWQANVDSLNISLSKFLFLKVQRLVLQLRQRMICAGSKPDNAAASLFLCSV